MQCAPLEFRFLLQNKRRGELVYSGVVVFLFFLHNNVIPSICDFNVNLE